MPRAASASADLTAGGHGPNLDADSPSGSPPLWMSPGVWASPAVANLASPAAHRWPAASMSCAAGFAGASPLSSSSSVATEGLRWALARRSASSSSLRRGVTTSEPGGGVLGAVQRQIQALEDRLAQQIARAQRLGECQVDNGLRQLEARMSASEVAQPKIGQRLAELSGQLKGLTEEVQSQMLRFDSLDVKLSDWRRELDDELQQKIEKTERHLEASAAEVLRLDSLDARLEDWRRGLGDELQQKFLKLERRLEASAAEVLRLDSLYGKLGDWQQELSEELQSKFLELQRHPEMSGVEQSAAFLGDAGSDAASTLDGQWQEASQRLHTLCEEVNRSELQLQEQGIRLEQQECCSKSLSGHVKGLMEEMQSQVLRTEELDARLSVCRRELAEDVQPKLLSMQQRLDSECGTAKELPPPPPPPPPPQRAANCTADAGLYAFVTENGCDRRFAEAATKFQVLREEVTQSQALAQDQGIRLEATLSRLEAQEICYRKLSAERLDWDSRLEQIHQGLRDEDRRCGEVLATLSHRVETQEKEFAKLGACVSDLNKLVNKVDGQERELSNLGEHVSDLLVRSQTSNGQLVSLRERMDASVVQLEEMDGRLDTFAKQKPPQVSRHSLSCTLLQKIKSPKVDSSVQPVAAISSVHEDAAVNDTNSTMRQEESLVEIQDVLEEILPKVAEHDRSTRVLLCDVLPRLGELSDSRDDVRRSVVAIGERLSAAEKELRCLHCRSPGHPAVTANGATMQHAGHARPALANVHRRLDLENVI